MLIGIPMETLAGETRVAVTPETVKKLKAQGHTLRVQSGAGIAASVTDEAYVAAGAEITDAAGALGADMVLKVRAPQADERAQMKPGAVLIGMLNPFDKDGLQAMTDAKLTAFALEAAPRTTRAQSMDVLSSQANLAGYKAVMIAADKYQRIFPMLMTAAGTVKAARVVILGVGVAGLQAIATAKRLGAVIEASDVRPSVKEQVESLGAKFIDVPYETAEEKEAAEGVGGYARPMPPSWLERQKAEVAKRVAQADVVLWGKAFCSGKNPHACQTFIINSFNQIKDSPSATMKNQSGPVVVQPPDPSTPGRFTNEGRLDERPLANSNFPGAASEFFSTLAAWREAGGLPGLVLQDEPVTALAPERATAASSVPGT